MAGGEHVFINWIFNNISKNIRILEFGSGNASTKQLTENGYKLISVEHDKKYLNRYKSDYIHAPLINGWYDVNKLTINRNYGCIIIDGPPGVNNSSRLGFFRNIHLFDTNVPILIHDTERKFEKILAEKISIYVKRKIKILDENVNVGKSALI